MQKWLRRTFWIALIASILLHLFLAIFVVYMRIPMPGEHHQDPIEVFNAAGKLLTDQLVKGNRLIPKKADHIGVEDNAVTQETVARPRQEQPVRRPRTPDAPPEERESPIPRPRASRGPKSKLPFTRDSLYAVDPRVFTMKQPTEQKLNRNLEAAAPKRRSLPRTAVSSTMNFESQAYLSEDYYPNYNYGNHTYLNVLKYPDVDYFVRLKRAFKQTWNPIPSVQRYYMGGGEQRSTIAVVLGVSVDENGNMSELFVLRSSGSGDYDGEALRTIRANSPFSAPPERLLKDGLLRMSWTFVVYM